MLLFDGQPIWFHSINSQQLIIAIFDYIDAMLGADRYLPSPATLADHIFNGFAWEGVGQQSQVDGVTQPAQRFSIPPQSMLFLTHADTDLLTLSRATENLPEDFPQVQAINLKILPTVSHVDEFIRAELPKYQVVVLRSWGGRQGFAHGFDRLVQAAQRQEKDLICIPGTEGLDPELTAHSTVPVPIIHDAYRYLHFGGVDNMGHLLNFLADNLLMGGYGYDQPVEQPRHGVYRPAGRGAEGQGREAAAQLPPLNRRSSVSGHQPTIGILFYRSHYLSGNTDFVDTLIDEVEAQGAKALPVFTTSLRETLDQQTNQAFHQSPESPAKIPAAFEYLSDDRGSPVVDVLICTISFAMGAMTNHKHNQPEPKGVTTAGWHIAALEDLGVPIIQAITSGMPEDEWRISERGLRPLDVAMNVALPEFDGRIISVPLSFKGQKELIANTANNVAVVNGSTGSSAGNTNP